MQLAVPNGSLPPAAAASSNSSSSSSTPRCSGSSAYVVQSALRTRSDGGRTSKLRFATPSPGLPFCDGPVRLKPRAPIARQPRRKNAPPPPPPPPPLSTTALSTCGSGCRGARRLPFKPTERGARPPCFPACLLAWGGRTGRQQHDGALSNGHAVVSTPCRESRRPVERGGIGSEPRSRAVAAAAWEKRQRHGGAAPRQPLRRRGGMGSGRRSVRPISQDGLW
eukprot:235199-Chlamydomonas_euryale.AAC.3